MSETIFSNVGLSLHVISCKGNGVRPCRAVQVPALQGQVTGARLVHT